MLFIRRFRVAILGLFLVFAAQPALAQKAVPLSAYGALPDVENAAISPSGENIAVLLTVDGERQLYFINSEMKLIKRIRVGDMKVRYFRWVGDDRLMLVTGKTEDIYGFTTNKAELSIAQIIPVTFEGAPKVVFKDDKKLVSSIFGDYGARRIGDDWFVHFGALELKPDTHGTNIPTYVFDHGRPFLYSYDVNRNAARRLAAPAREGEDRDWLIDARGEVAVTLDVSQYDGQWQLRGQNGIKLASGTERNGRAWLVGLGYDGTTVIYGERDADNISHWYEVPLAGGTPKLFLDDADVDRLYFNDATGHLMGYLDRAGKSVFVDPATQKSARDIRSAFNGFETRLVDWTPDFKTVLVRTSGNQDSGTWYVVNLSEGRAKAFAYERVAIGPQEVGPISTVEYVAQDGLEMDGILTLPPGREAKNLPVVMLPHGGPHAQDRAEFDWWAQAFAARGYAVFQPNFRGSTNRSQQFKLAGYGEWGRKMQTDISDGLAALAEKGIVDPSRACIVGASYGGYAALAGVTIQQGIYRCAVGVAAVTDLNDMYQEDYRASGGERITKMALLDQLGPKDRWNEVSPRRLAERADAPIMLIHGRDDTVVPYSHSSQMASKLKSAGKPYELVELKGEDHWLSLSETRHRMLEASVKFVEEHNPAD